jgi:hypothetical protein
VWLTRLSKPFIRFRLNARHNRFFVIYGGYVYLRNPLALRALTRDVIKDNRPLATKKTVVYTRVDWRGLFTRADPSQYGITIPHLGRFGNTMAVFMPVFARSIAVGIGNIIVHGDSVLAASDGLRDPGVYQLGPDVTLWAGVEPSARENTVLRLVTTKSLRFAIDHKYADKAWQEALSLLFAGSAVVPRDESHLVIHLRGGDVYGTRLLPNHGQPPLSYYTKILRLGGWSEVTIVHQGPGIPVLKPLVEYCTSLGLPVTTQSASFREDMVTLFGAQTLVVGRGSFAPSVIGLSPNVKTVFFFQNGFGMNPPKSGVAFTRILDIDGEYIQKNLSHMWRNTPEQVQLMLEYPEDKLDFDPELPPHGRAS